MPSESVLARISEFLESIWEHPSAAAQFVESPDTALASQGLSQSDLQGVDLSAVAGGLAGGGGMSPEGQRVLTDFAQSPGSSGHYGGTPVQQIGHVTRAVHHDNPTVQKVFVDNHQTFNIDNSVNFNNNGGVINGDVTLSNNASTTIATGHGTALGPGAHDNVIAGPGGVAAGGNVAQADHGAVVGQGSGGNSGDSGNSGQDGQDAQGQGHGGSVEPDLSFGDGATPEQADHHGDQSDHGGHGRDDQNHDDQQEEGGDHRQSGQDHDPSHDPTAVAPDPTLVEGHDDHHDPFQARPGVEDLDHDQGAHHGPGADLDHV